MESNFKDFELSLKRKDFSKKDVDNIKKAWEFALIAHTGQKRVSGEPYVAHSLAVAKILLDWNLDTPSIIAGILHDSVEDGGAKITDIEKEFGEEVSKLVSGVTNISTLHLRGSTKDVFVENLRKMFFAMAKDLRIVLIRLADRYHNMQTLEYLSSEKKDRISKETLEVYAPLAERLGMGEVKAQLEDLAFPFVYPGEYEKLVKLSKPHYKEAEIVIEKMKRNLLKKLSKQKIKAEIHGRKKHLYSLWHKLNRPGIDGDFEKIYDIVALRILVPTLPECYTTLGIVHGFYKMVPSLGVSDFIAQPKPNGYRSIHTKVFGSQGRIVEVQIRTYKMHEEAEYGIAAHWAYSELKKTGVSDELLKKEGGKAPSEKLSWVKQLADWQKEITDSKEFLSAVKFDALSKRIYVFSPKGDVFDLPQGATPVDFAFKVHTNLAFYLKGAKVNEKVVSLNYPLQNGQVVEIIKYKNPHPFSEGWLNFVVTVLARREIKKYLRKDSLKD